MKYNNDVLIQYCLEMETVEKLGQRGWEPWE